MQSDNTTDPQAETHPHLRQLAIQATAAFAVLSVAWPYYLIRHETLPWLAVTLLIGTLALGIASLARQPWWWRLIHFAFAPLAWCATWLSVPPEGFLLAFVVMLAIYRSTLSGHPPLFLSSRQSAAAVAQLIAQHEARAVIDLGSGVGTVTSLLARTLPGVQVRGIENSPAPWLLGRLRTATQPNCTISWGDFWQADLSGYDVAYAFLSPRPMQRLWEKVRAEMRPGSLLISNSFPVPEADAASIVEIDDFRKTRLFVYRV